MASRTEQDIETAVRAQLERDTRVDLGEASIRVSIADGRVALEGEVPDIAAKRIAANLTRQLVDEDAEVDDRLCVQTEQAGDGEIGDRICDLLIDDSAFAEHGIVREAGGQAEPLQQPPRDAGTLVVGVREGVVTLRGKVASLTHRRLAEVLCWWVPGCRRVDNRLVVEPVQADSDNLLTDAVRIVLEKDPLVDAAQIRMGSAAGIVELDGLLPDEVAHRLAVRDAWSVPGVWDIDDRIRTGSAPP